MSQTRQELLYKALKSKYEAERDEAVATLDIYFHNSVGIGEHPQHIEEMDKFINKLTNANDNLETLKTFFAQYGPR